MEARRVRIFLLDAHSLVRDGLKLHLRTVPQFELVGEAGSARGAIAQLELLRADVLLMDIGPNALDGVELEAFIALLNPMAVLVLGWQAQPSVVTRAMRAGARGYMLKDAPAERILDAVHTVAAGGICLGSGIAGGLFRTPPSDSDLSRREREVLGLVGQGKPSKVIAQQLCVSLRTVESHRQNIKRKLQLDGHASLIKYAVEHGAYPESAGESTVGLPRRPSSSLDIAHTNSMRLNG
jgi:DNA-binding NarL/FixJ family response regulator